jgi:hypothetical protein
MDQPPDSSSIMVVNLPKGRPFGDLVNEHSFILNHSPQDGKIFREALMWFTKRSSILRQDAFRCWIVAGREGMWSERESVPSCGILAFSPIPIPFQNSIGIAIGIENTTAHSIDSDSDSDSEKGSGQVLRGLSQRAAAGDIDCDRGRDRECGTFRE